MLPLLDKTIKFPPSSLPFNPPPTPPASDKTEASHYNKPYCGARPSTTRDTEQFRSSYIGWRRPLAREFLPFVYYTTHTRLLDHSYGKKENCPGAPTPQIENSQLSNTGDNRFFFSASWVSCQGGEGTQRSPEVATLHRRIMLSGTPYIPNTGGARYNPNIHITHVHRLGRESSDVLTRTFHPPPIYHSHSNTRTRVRTRCICIHGHMNIVRSFRTSQPAPILLYPPLRSLIPSPLPIPRVSSRYV